MNFLPASDDFQDDLGLGGGLGDIPDHLVGSAKSNLKIDEDNSDESLRLSEMFAARVESNLHLIPNNERLAHIYNTGLEAQRKKQMNDVLKMAKLKATIGKSASEIFQTLKKDLTDDEIRSLPSIRDLLNAPCIWAKIIDDPTAFDNCAQAKSKFRDLDKNRKSLYVLSNTQCSGCRENEHNRCHKLGKKLIEGLDFTPEMFGEISEALRMDGLIAAGESVISKDGIKNAFSPKRDSSVRVYNAPKREKTATMPANEAMAQLHSFSVKKAEEENQNQQDSITGDAKLIAIKILPLIYKNANKIEIQNVDATLFSPERKKLFHELYNGLNEDPLLKSRLAFPRLIFSSCKQAKTFMDENDIKTGYIKAIDQCNDCKNNIEGQCHLLKGALLAKNARVAEHDRFAAIDNACSNSGDAKKFKEIERNKYLAGLRQALKETGRKTALSNEVKSNLLDQTSEKFAENNEALALAVTQLSSGIPISSVRTMLRTRMHKSAADSSIEEILYSLPYIRAEMLDDCMCSSHQFKNGAVIIKAEQCSLCQYATVMECLKTKLPFGTGELPRIEEAQQTREGREILDMFYNPEKELDTAPYAKITGIQVDLNPDSGQIYELGKLENTELPDMSVPDMVIDVNPRISTEQGLEIEDLGSADGWDIGGCL